MMAVTSRRIAAVALPQLGVELVRQKLLVDGPLAVLFSYGLSDSHIEEGQTRSHAKASIDLVDETASSGLAPGAALGCLGIEPATLASTRPPTNSMRSSTMTAA